MDDKETLIKNVLKEIGENPDREGLRETPQRIVKMWNEIYKGYDKDKLPVVTTFNNGSDGIIYDQMINDLGDFYSQCEHHKLPFIGKYYFAYIPNPKGKILGLSKVARVVDYFSSKLQIQERLTHEIVEYLWTILCNICEYPPIGMGLVLEAEHLCKTMRGAKKKGEMRTTYLKGTIKTDILARSEFLDWVNVKCSR